MKKFIIGIGEFFMIGNTPSYPKLRTEYGYIDVRDEIKKIKEKICDSWELTLMTKEEVLKQFKACGFKTIGEVENLKNELLIK